MKKTLRTLAASVLLCAAAFFTFVACNEEEEAVPVTGVTISPAGAQTLTVGGTLTLTLTAKVTPDDASNKAVKWTSSSSATASLSAADGATVVVTAEAAGTTTITVTTVDGGKKDQVTVTVVAGSDDPDNPVRVTGVTIDQDGPVELVKDSTLTLTATVAPTNASTPTVTWTSSSTVTATVDADGVVTAVAVGAATITVTTDDGEYTDIVGVTVVAPRLTATLTEAGNVPNGGGTREISVESNVGWTVTSSENWLELSTGTGNAGNGTVTVIVQPNDTFDERSATVTFTYGDAQTETVNVTQEAAVPALLSPAADSSFILSKNLDGNITFSWLAAATSYEVIVAKDADLTEVVYSQSDLTGTSHAVAEADIQTLLESTTGLKRYKKNVLYWNVRINGENISPAPRTLTLYGQRFFVDKRAEIAANYGISGNDLLAEPAQTYAVAVVEYNNKEVVWLAEDLRAKAAWVDWMGLGIKTAWSVYQTADDDCSKLPLPEKYLNRLNTANPSEAIPPAGRYYGAPYAHELFPRSSSNTQVWRIPSEADWGELFTAAVAAHGGAYGDNVLRHPLFTVSGSAEHANEWGMNILANGAFSWTPECGDDFLLWNEHEVTYVYGTYPGDVGTGNCYVWDANSKTGKTITNRNGSLFRLIYIGDDN